MLLLFQTNFNYFRNVTLENLQFLTIEQNLADIAAFVQNLRESYEEFNSSKIILYGVDLGAAYAVWAKQRYPSLIDGVLAYGAQVNAIFDFTDYWIGLQNNLENEVPECVDIINLALYEIDDLIYRGEGELLQEYFTLTAPVNTSSAQDIGSFYLAINNLLGILFTNAP